MRKKVRIFKKDGTATPYFFSSQDRDKRKTVYKRTSEGVKRMKGVSFDPTTNLMHRD